MKPVRQHKLRIITAYLLLAAVSFFFTPKELVHNFLNHDDTCDTVTHNSNQTHIENLHEHCDLDQYSVPPLFHEVTHFSFISTALLCTHSSGQPCNYHFSGSTFLFFRGPPALI
ncbi:MAG: hypothetical protein IPP86_03860 [Bacteroidetes bacterium]|nr:hypothetical protein [Bacteroidota bacterium]MBL0137651.1 hypothetical protein [Bacteroidota bacterium]